MEEVLDTNNLTEEVSPPEVHEFKYDLINTPWDDRTRKSKVSIIVLLVSISLAIAILAINGLFIQYRGFSAKNKAANFEVNCQLVKMGAGQYRYIALIISVETKDLLCVGAVVSSSGILANHVCVRSGPVIIRLGSPTEPRCRKNFAADIREIIHHDGVVAKNLVLLITDENISECADIIPVGLHLNENAKTYIIGRPFYSGKSLARRQVTVKGQGNCTMTDSRTNTKINLTSTICVQDHARCPVRAGDLLVQDKQLFGLASTSVHRNDPNKIVLFADLTLVRDELIALDVQVNTDDKHILRNIADNVTEAERENRFKDKVIDTEDPVRKNITVDTDETDLRNMAALISFALDLKNATTNITNAADIKEGLAKIFDVDSHVNEVTVVSGTTNTTIIQSDVVNNTVE